MNVGRITTILLHSWYHFWHSMETWVDLFLNSIIQMSVFVFIALYFSGGQSLQGKFMIAGAILWNIIWVGQYTIAVGALWEIWSKNLSSLFVTPLTLEEFLTGHMIAGLIKSLASMSVTALVGFMMYRFSILQLNLWLIVYIAELIVFSWAMGMFVLAIILRFGTNVQSLSWLLVFLVQPFGAVFFPVTVLPRLLQTVSFGLPVTYVFEAIRAQISHGVIETNGLFIATILNLVYFVVSYLFIKFTFAAAKKSGGFAQIET